MAGKEESYAFPWGFHIGDLHNERETIPLYTHTNDGGFCLLYDKVSEKKADTMLESLCLEMLSIMPHGSLKVNLLDFGKKKFYNLSPLQYMEVYRTAYDDALINTTFGEIEKSIISRHENLLCCTRPSISEHNQKSKLKEKYHLMLINLDHFPSQEYELRRIQNFVESAALAGVYVIAFGYEEIEESKSETVQAILKHFKTLRVTAGEFAITKEIFEFTELLEDHSFKSLDLDKQALLQKVLANGNLEKLMDPESQRLVTDADKV